MHPILMPEANDTKEAESATDEPKKRVRIRFSCNTCRDKK